MRITFQAGSGSSKGAPWVPQGYVYVYGPYKDALEVRLRGALGVFMSLLRAPVLQPSLCISPWVMVYGPPGLYVSNLGVASSESQRGRTPEATTPTPPTPKKTYRREGQIAKRKPDQQTQKLRNECIFEQLNALHIHSTQPHNPKEQRHTLLVLTGP